MKGVEEVTLRLVDKEAEFCEFQERNITCGNLYTSISLSQELLNRGVTVVGTPERSKLVSFLDAHAFKAPASSISHSVSHKDGFLQI